MLKTNYHTHSNWSDGALSPEATVIKAIELGFDIIGFSDHAPVPFKSDWNMKYKDLLRYIKDIKRLKKEYKGKIKIFTGIEADYIKDVSAIEMFRHYELDYIIGGVHYLNMSLDDKDFFNIDSSPRTFQKGLRSIFNDDIKLFIKEYYKEILSMIKDDGPDVIAHFDLIEKFNDGFKFFNSNADWYQEIIEESLKKIADCGCILELNCRSKYKGFLKDYSPRLKILKKAFNYNIPITISGDVHSPIELSLFWEEAIETLKSVGYTEMMYFDENGWQAQKIK